MGLLVERGAIITALCDHLRANVPELKLVKPYYGELDRYSKKTQLKDETFPAMVNMTTPFALVISKNRKRVEDKGPSLRFRHDISVYIGDSNPHNFSSSETPNIFSIMTKCVEALHGKSFIKGCGILNVESDGDYLITRDLFTVYDQQYYQLEIGT